MVDLWCHLRLRRAANDLRDQGHVVTQHDAGTISYEGRQDKNPAGCLPDRVDIGCPVDWNPAYRAVINQPGRRYRVDDAQLLSGTAMLMVYW